ncbi:hypothetical protein OAU26_05605, partial [Mariniblastus sp.]|nr:hypothetical protein [Mariniblastus sp.]
SSLLSRRLCLSCNTVPAPHLNSPFSINPHTLPSPLETPRGCVCGGLVGSTRRECCSHPWTGFACRRFHRRRQVLF